MLRNWLWTIVVLLVVGAGVCFALYKYTDVFNRYLGVPASTAPAVGTAENPIPFTPPTSYSLYPNYVSPPNAENSEVVGPVPVTAISSTQITVQLTSGQPRTFAIASSTVLYTVVLNNGQVGKSLSDIRVGDLLNVHWYKETPGTTNALAYPANKVLGVTADDDNHEFGGTVVGLSSKEIIIVPPVSSHIQPLTISIPPMPTIGSVVLTGQKGLNLLVGQVVVARGVVTNGTTTTAKAIFINFFQ